MQISRILDHDNYFLISSEEMSNLLSLLREECSSEGLSFLESLILSKVFTIKDPIGGMIYFD